ncbi:MAG: signal peptidase II [Holophagales bacterium]|jgi:signal peptidase II|nr:signal peptidase II [Holophagales bacterium]
MKQRLLWLILPLTALLLDIVSKIWVLKILKPGEQLTVIKGFFYIKLTFNPGAIFGVLQNASPWLRGAIFLVAGLAAFVYFGWEFIKSNTPGSHRCALGLILGGALGNGLDRLVRGHVVDFLDFWFGSWEYWVFNLADSFIVSGAILYGIVILISSHTESHKRTRLGIRN